jgi:hypothetical protein
MATNVLLAGKTNRRRIRPTSIVLGDRIGNQISVYRPARGKLERLDVNECALATVVGHDEAVTLLIIPAGNSPYSSHD